MIDHRAGRLGAEPSCRVGARGGEGAIGRLVVDEDLVPGRVVRLDEDGVLGVEAEPVVAVVAVVRG